MKKIFIFMFLLITFTYGNSENIIGYNIEYYPENYDPQLNTDALSGDILSYAFEGLTRLDAKGNPIPAVAESWSNTGDIWTFKLRKTAKWHNGDTVVAKDFVDAWERFLNPNVNSDYSYIMYCIKGAQEYNEGTYKDFSLVGIKAIDSFTFQVTLKEPVIYFPSLASFYSFYPQNTKFLKTLKNSKYGSSYADILGNGAFEIHKLKKISELSLIKSDKYWNKSNIKIDVINLSTFHEDDIFRKFETKKIDISELNSENFSEYKNFKNIQTYEDGSIWYLTLNTDNYLFSNKKIRKALSMAIDRKFLVNNVKSNLGSIAESFIPNVIKGNSDFYRNEYNQYIYDISYNPQKAKKYFEDGLVELGLNKSEIGTICLLVGNNNTAVADGDFLIEQFKKNLDLDVILEPVTFEIRCQRKSSKDYDIIFGGWAPDYNDPMAYLEMWTTNSSENYEIWHNQDYDEIIELAKKERDFKKRIDLLAGAERVLINESPIVPLYFRKKAFLINPNIGKVNFNLFYPKVNFIYD